MRKSLLNLHYILATCLLLLLPSLVRAVDLVVIVSSKSQVLALEQSQIADIFLGQKAYFPNGTEAIALDQSVGAPIRDAFYLKVTAKSPPLVKAFWSKMIFTGRGQPPKEVRSSAEIRKLVADNPSLISYIDRTGLDPSVRVVLAVH